MIRLVTVALAACIGFVGLDTARGETGTLVHELPVANDCVPISLTGQFALKPAADSLIPTPAHFDGFRRNAMNAIAAGKRPKGVQVLEIAVNAAPGSSLTIPAAQMREALLGLSVDQNAVAGLPDDDYTANYLEPGVYLFEISKAGSSEFRLLTAQPLLALVLPDKQLGLRLEVALYSVNGVRAASTGQVLYPYPVCLQAEIATSNLTVNLGEFGTFRNGGIVVTPEAIHVLPGTEYTPYLPTKPSVADDTAAALTTVADTDDQAVLARIALNTRSTRVILAALEKIEDQDLLEQLAVELQWPRGREHAMLKVTDQSFLKAAAFGNDIPMVRRAAAWSITDQQILLEVALSDSDYAIRRDAAQHIDDTRLLESIADTSDYQSVTTIANKSLGRDENTLNLNGRLLVAAGEGNTQSVARLLDDGAAVNSVDAELNSALIKAAVIGNAELASLLLARGADIDMKNNKRVSALSAASARGHAKVVDILLQNGAFVDSTVIDLSTPLMLAAHQGYEAIVTALVDADASVNLQSRDGRTALMVAARQGHAAIVATLMDANADVTLKDADGETAADVAKSAAIRNRITPD